MQMKFTANVLVGETKSYLRFTYFLNNISKGVNLHKHPLSICYSKYLYRYPYKNITKSIKNHIQEKHSLCPSSCINIKIDFFKKKSLFRIKQRTYNFSL